MGIVLGDGSGVAIDWVTGRSYSSARRRLNVQSGQCKGGKCAAAPYPSVAEEKVLREADGSVKLVVVRPHTDGKVFAPGCASKPDGESREEPEEHKRKEVELVDSVDELRSSLSIRGISMPNFEVLDARIASALKKSSIIPSSKGESVWRNKRPRKRTVSFEVDRLPT